MYFVLYTCPEGFPGNLFGPQTYENCVEFVKSKMTPDQLENWGEILTDQGYFDLVDGSKWLILLSEPFPD